MESRRYRYIRPPRQVAVSLEYGGHGTVPKVTASGMGEVAEAILQEARKQGVFVSEDPQLAQALSSLDLEQPIPESLYTAVAILLAWSYWLRGWSPD